MYDFSEAEKAEAFDLIAKNYYEKNFGSMTKSNIDILMFWILLKQRWDKGQAIDDYTLSRELGINETKIRTLKQNATLQYSRQDQFDWKEDFAKCAANAKYDKTKQLVKMTIPEIITLQELRHFVIENGLYDEYQLNPRLFQCRLDVFVEICELLNGGKVTFDEKSKENIKSLKGKIPDEENWSAVKKILKGYVKDGILDLAKSASSEVLSEVLDLIPFSGVAKTLIRGLCNVL